MNIDMFFGDVFVQVPCILNICCIVCLILFNYEHTYMCIYIIIYVIYYIIISISQKKEGGANSGWCLLVSTSENFRFSHDHRPGRK